MRSERLNTWIPAALAAGAAAVYIAVNGLWNAPPTGDGVGYEALGLSLAQGKGLVYMGYHSLRLPGYPLLIAGLYRLFGPETVYIRLFQLLLQAASSALLYRAARVRFDERTSLAACLLYAVSYDAFIMPSQILTECMFSLLLIAGAYMALLAAKEERGPGFYAAEGLVAGAAYMARQEVTILFGCTLLLRWFFSGRRLPAKAVLLPGLAFLLVLGSWGARNWKVHGRFFVGSTLSYRHLLAANMLVFTPLGADFSSIGLTNENIDRVDGETDEFKREERRKEWTGEMFRLAPAKLLVKAVLYKVSSFLYPFLPVYDLTYMLALPFLLLGLWLNLPRFRELYPLYAFLAMLAFVVLLFHGIPRFRSPVTHMASLFAASGFLWLTGKDGPRRGRAAAAVWTAANLVVFFWAEPLRQLVKRLVFGGGA